jgi:hypothetical protein
LIYILAVLIYVLLVLAGIQFFRQVHRWDEQALAMFEVERSRNGAKQATHPSVSSNKSRAYPNRILPEG